MTIRLIKLFLLAILIAASIYFISLNNYPIVVSILPENSVKTTSGVALLCVFALGILIGVAGTSLQAIKLYLKERSLRRKEAKQLDFENEFIEIQKQSTLDSLRVGTRKIKTPKAKSLWNHLLKSYAPKLWTYLSYIDYLTENKNIDEAIKVLDEAKKLFPTSVQVLIKSATVQELQGNKTAALDNINLILGSHDIPELHLKAAILSLELLRYNDCIEHLDRINSSEIDQKKIYSLKADAIAKILILEAPNNYELSRKLITHLEQYESSLVALLKLADLQYEFGQIDESAQSLWRAFTLSKDTQYLHLARQRWIQCRKIEKLLAAQRQLARESSNENVFLFKLELAKSQVFIGKLDEANQTLAEISELPKLAKDIELSKEILILKALIAFKEKDKLQIENTLNKILELEIEAL